MLEEVWENGSDVDEIIKTKGLVQIQDESLLEEIAKKVIDANPDQVAAYKSGKDKLFGFFVGQVMKETQGKANPKVQLKFLKIYLNNLNDKHAKRFSNKCRLFYSLNFHCYLSFCKILTRFFSVTSIHFMRILTSELTGTGLKNLTLSKP